MHVLVDASFLEGLIVIRGCDIEIEREGVCGHIYRARLLSTEMCGVTAICPHCGLRDYVSFNLVKSTIQSYHFRRQSRINRRQNVDRADIQGILQGRIS
jgi:hypothetical protein